MVKMKKLILVAATILSVGLMAMPVHAAQATAPVRDPIISPEREDPEVPELPDPNDPDSPDVVTVTDENGTPVNYYRVTDPVPEYITEEEAIRRGILGARTRSPQTGEEQMPLLLLAGIFGVSAAGLFIESRKKTAA